MWPAFGHWQPAISNPGRDIPLYSPTDEYNSKNGNYKKNDYKMAISRRFVQITDKVKNKIKITCVQILKQLLSSGSVIFGEYSPHLHLSLGE